ncbi:MAG: DUF4097 domain-containing protein [Gemmatimonadaceae bacterium]|jgi:hypothetical protein|nr:DUF4097 domain-containing protein [Gemmatimonadaceae bacterium]
MPRLSHTLAALAVSALASQAGAQPSVERVTIPGTDFSVFNLAGTMRVESGDGASPVVEVTLRGRDAARLRVTQTEVRGRPAVVVRYPDDDIVYGDGARWSGSASIRVRNDGTWGGDDSGWRSRETVRISSRGRGTEAWADVVIRAPRNARVAAYQAVGSLRASAVTVALLRGDTHSASVDLRDVRGDVEIDVGSGDTQGIGIEGRVSVDAGSGRTDLRNVRGPRVFVDAGSGDVALEDITAEEITVDVGSGQTTVTRADTRSLHVDAGSGGVRAQLTRAVADVLIDTGSGGVELFVPDRFDARLEIETGSGGVETELPIQLTRADRTSLSGRMGSGTGSVRVDTGSGRVRIRRAP